VDSSGAPTAKHGEIPHYHLLERLENIVLEMWEGSQLDVPPDFLGTDWGDTVLLTT
jgi:hypothetical protein